MGYDRRLLLCVAVSLLAHGLFARGVERLPPRAPVPASRTVEVRLTPPPEPEPPPPEPEPAVAELPSVEARPRPPTPVRSRTQKPSDRPTPPTERPATDGPTSDVPVYGVTMQSTSQGGSGPAVPVGNTTLTKPTAARPGPTADVLPLPPPVDDVLVSKMPLPLGRCSGTYTEAARAAGVEGVVVLDLVVGEDGRARDVKVIEGLGHGLTASAVAAVKACRFTPGERNGVRVAVRIRSFKIRFLMREND
jgi:periplasmic protein TonB